MLSYIILMNMMTQWRRNYGGSGGWNLPSVHCLVKQFKCI